MDYLELSDIDKEIAIEFGLEAIGFGGNRIKPNELRNAQKEFEKLPKEKQDEIVLAFFNKLI